MSAQERQQQFENAIRSHPDVLPSARIAKNFGFSNSARIIEGGLFACTNNLQTYSANLANGTGSAADQFVFLCVLTFPPHEEVYFAINVRTEAGKIDSGLIKLFHEGTAKNTTSAASGGKPGSISNNVKFYVTDSGQIYFHNYDFMESLGAGVVLDPACLALVDAIHFSIWPPAVSAQRSLLAREFVGYLGSLIGRDRVHEIAVWTDAAAVSPEMRRKPDTIDVIDIENAVQALGGHYPKGEVRRLHGALNFLEHKHFVILSGLSGSGKTQLALQYARAVHGVASMHGGDPFLVVCPVRPEWTDPAGLTGYYDVLSNRYVVPPFLEAMMLATAHPQSPVFVVLDEMNLARVEYYFSDLLSALETRSPLQLHSSGVPLEASSGASVPAALPMPTNLYIVGTINVDETTNPVSDKVLDRAVVIDMSEVDLAGFFVSLEKRDPSLSPSRLACEATLLQVHAILKEGDLGFGYRLAEEVVRYHAFATTKLTMTSGEAIDDLLVQKVLVKLKGGERHRAMLARLAKELASAPRSAGVVSKMQAELDEYGSFQVSR